MSGFGDTLRWRRQGKWEWKIVFIEALGEFIECLGH